MSCWRGPRFARRIWKGGGGRVGKGALIEIGCCRFRQTLNVPKSGKPDFGARRAHQAAAFGGHAEPVIGPAQRVRPLAGPMAGSGRTRWLCPPYGASIRPKLAVARSTFRPLLDSGLLAPTPCRAGFGKRRISPVSHSSRPPAPWLLRGLRAATAVPPRPGPLHFPLFSFLRPAA